MSGEGGGLTLEFFWILARPFGSKHELAACFDIVERLPGVEWQRYDLDTMALWKTWSPERVLVDAQTQRTAMVRAEGTLGAMAVLALGKRGEPPTLLVRRDFTDPDEASAYFDASIERTLADGVLNLVRAGVAPKAARDAYHRKLPGMSAVGRFEVPAWLSVLRAEDDLLAGRPLEGIVAERRELSAPGVVATSFVRYALLDDPRRPPAQAVERWERLAQALARAD